MSQQAFFAPLSRRNSENTFFSIFTTFHIWGGSPPGIWCLLGLSGEGLRLATDITAWLRPCLHCQQAKVHRHTHQQPQPVPILQRHFSHLHIDLVGLLQNSGSSKFIFTGIDRTSKWMEAIPLSDMSAAACAKALICSWISRFGVSEMIISDRETQFTSNIWSKLCEMLHISHHQTTECHPESNGTVKRLHRRPKDALRARASTATTPSVVTASEIRPPTSPPAGRARAWGEPCGDLAAPMVDSQTHRTGILRSLGKPFCRPHWIHKS
jgi:hypothetical protein